MSDAPRDLPFTTLAELPFFVAGRYPKDLLVARCRESGVSGWSTREFFDRVRDVALGLQALGVARGDRVAIVAESRPEWLLVDLAALTLGAVVVPVYPTLTATQACYVLADAGARIAIASTPVQAGKVLSVRHALPALEAVVVMDPDESTAGGSVVALEDISARGHRRIMDGWGLARTYQDEARTARPGDLATLIYTSGTTGEPKGVRLTHDNVVSNVKAALEVLRVTEADTALSFLPLSHSFERTVAYLYLAAGVTIAFAESLQTVGRDLLAVRPTVITGVPRVYEKLHARIVETAQSASAARRGIFTWALGVGLARVRAEQAGRAPGRLVTLQLALADRLVFSKIRARLGGRLGCLVSGSAALPRAIGEFFHATGLRLVEGYGLTETAPILTVNPLTATRIGTVGKAIPGVELRIADDGEILARGPNVMAGYYNKPEASAAVLRNGWFHTGDVGHLDADGYLTITDRKKDVLVTSGGKKIAPQPIEGVLKTSPIVAEAVLLGERRKFPALLIVPEFGALERRLADLGRPVGPRAELVGRPDVLALYQELVDGVNRDLAQFERIKRFALLPEEFTIERGELTPTMKVRRRAVEERWHAVIEDMYREGEEGE